MKLRFSIRDLLWLTAVCAVLVAWWLDHRALKSDHRYVIKEVPNILPNYSGKTCMEITNLNTGGKTYTQPFQ
jgi:hypothetical protein